MNFFSFNNKYGRPIPYVWFLIIAVSSVPMFMINSIDESIPCNQDYILNGRTMDEYFKQKHFTIDEALQQCDGIKSVMKIMGVVFSGVLFVITTYSLKPWPLSSPTQEDTGSKTPI